MTNVTGTSGITGLGTQTVTLPMGNQDITGIKDLVPILAEEIISSGSIVGGEMYIKIEVESGSTDDLDHITDSAFWFSILSSDTASEDIVFKDGITAPNTINMINSADFTCTNIRDTVTLIRKNANNILCIAVADNA